MKPLLDYLSGLEVTEGPLQGDKLTVLDWQQESLEGVFAPDTITSAISVPRAAGKTTFVSAVASAYLAGPLRVKRGTVILVAASFGQARLAFNHILATLGLTGKYDRKLWRIQDSANTASVEHRETGATLRCLGSDPRRLHGLAPVAILADEPSQWGPSGEAMQAALTTSSGKQAECKIIYFGTRPATPDHFFQRMLDGGADFSLKYAAGADDNPLSESTWLTANPSLKHFPALMKAYRTEAKQAAEDAAAMQTFKALRLNMGVPDVLEDTLIDPDSWLACEADILPARVGQPILGIDLGSSASASGFAAFWTNGRLEGHMTFGNEPDLQTRARKDRAGQDYTRMHAEGGIRLHAGCVPDVGDMLSEAIELYGMPSAIVMDRWRAAEMVDAQRKIGTNIPIIHRGMGYRDGGADVRDFRAAVLSKKVHVHSNTTWRISIGGARTETDPAGTSKLTKRYQRARDDLACAAILAVGEGWRRMNKPAPEPIKWAIS